LHSYSIDNGFFYIYPTLFAVRSAITATAELLVYFILKIEAPYLHYR